MSYGLRLGKVLMRRWKNICLNLSPFFLQYLGCLLGSFSLQPIYWSRALQSRLLAAECRRPIHSTMDGKERKSLVCLNCLCLHSQPDVRLHCDTHNGTKGLIVTENKPKQNTGC